MNTAEFLDYIGDMALAKVPILWVTTVEEDRAIALLKTVAHSQQVEVQGEKVQKHLLTWSVTEGFHDLTREEAEEKAQGAHYKRPEGTQKAPGEMLQHIMTLRYPAIIVIKDMHPLIEDSSPKKESTLIRRIRDIAHTFRESYKTVVHLTPSADVPRDLKDAVVRVDMPLPSRQELLAVLNDAISMVPPEILKGMFTNGDQHTTMERMADAGLGLTLRAYEDTIARCIVNRNLTIKEILKTKAQIIKQSGILEYVEPDATMADVGGLDNLKAWVDLTAERFSPEAEKAGVPKPKGVLIAGPAGTGKSLMAKVIGDRLKLPLVRLDMAKVVSSLYGRSTQNIAEAIRVTEGIAPCVLFIDEYEKSFGTTGGQEHEETARTRGFFLTWRQETKAPILVVATCNHHERIPPEDMRRFQRVFFADIPTPEELADIIRIHLKKYHQDEENMISETMLAEHMQDFTGAEVDTVITEAIGLAFHEKAQLTFDHILKVAAQIVPMARNVTKKAEIDGMRKDLENIATPASSKREAQVEEKIPRFKLIGG
jgi:ATP-dependent 26S proteasome regulatory subunit